MKYATIAKIIAISDQQMFYYLYLYYYVIINYIEDILPINIPLNIYLICNTNKQISQFVVQIIDVTNHSIIRALRARACVYIYIYIYVYICTYICSYTIHVYIVMSYMFNYTILYYMLYYNIIILYYIILYYILMMKYNI